MAIGPQRISAMLVLIEARARAALPAPSYAELAEAAGLSDAGSNISDGLSALRVDGKIRIERNAQRLLRFLHVESGCWTGWGVRRKAAAARADRVTRSIKKPGPRAGRQRRKCLRCPTMIDSTGPGDRLCRACKVYAADAAPIAIDSYAVRP